MMIESRIIETKRPSLPPIALQTDRNTRLLMIPPECACLPCGQNKVARRQLWRSVTDSLMWLHELTIIYFLCVVSSEVYTCKYLQLESAQTHCSAGLNGVLSAKTHVVVLLSVFFCLWTRFMCACGTRRGT